MKKPDLTPEEQQAVRTALKYLRIQMGGWLFVSKALQMHLTGLQHTAGGRKVVSARLAVRLAKLVGVKVDELLSGQYPAPGTCPYCGHRAAD